MTVFVVTSQQAKSGKTTIAMHLCEGLRKSAKTILLHVSTEGKNFEWAKQEQASFAFEHFERADEHVDMLEKSLEQAKKHYQHVVVDIAGQDAKALRAVLKHADKMLVPSTGLEQDLQPVAEMLALAISLKPYHPELKVYIVFNQIPTETERTELFQRQQLLTDLPHANFLNTVIYQDQQIEALLQQEGNIWQKLARKNDMIDQFVAEILQT